MKYMKLVVYLPNPNKEKQKVYARANPEIHSLLCLLVIDDVLPAELKLHLLSLFDLFGTDSTT